MHKKKYQETPQEQKSNDFQYKFTNCGSFISKDSIRLIKIKNKTMFTIRSDNQIMIQELFLINRQMKCLKKIPTELSMFSRNKFSVMNFTDSFLQANPVQEIQIWKQDRNCNWVSSKSLHDHSQLEVSDIIINAKDDLIISASNNGIIAFWSKELDWGMCQYLDLKKQFQVGLVLNKEGSRLIIYGEKHEILFASRDWNGQWIIKQTIQMTDFGNVNFLTNNTFAFMPERSSSIIIYEYSQQNQQFVLKETFDLQLRKFYTYRLQVEYLEQFDLLLAIRKNFFFLITKNEKGEQLIENQIQFPNDSVSFASMQNGRFLLTLEQVKEMKDSDYRFVRKLQIRSLQKKE